MADKMIQCPACEKEISSKAEQCPNCGHKMKKPIYKKWWFWVIIVVVMVAIGNMGGDTPDRPDAADNTQVTGEPSQPAKLPAGAETMCRALTNLFVEHVVGEEWHMLAFSVENYELDENGNGTIEVLYLPPNAGSGETKVNLTIEKSDDTYTIIYALLAGADEVDLSAVLDSCKTLSN